MPSDFKELIVWKQSILFAKKVYFISRSFPKDERYGLTSQLRRASVSISCNIAEGCGRRTSKDFASFIQCAWFMQGMRDASFVEQRVRVRNRW
ncbi:four helix bundle protein [Candidatus Woesearchaeota archaeon]|nr:four helix bundle protein [Candidatus Woesearchaeota archaeon]